LYATLPEVGDLPKPKLAFFFDEAHLLFDDASDALMDQIELMARLIRSKGVGVYFVTQSPTDVPSSVLSQLGNRVQHALRAFTPDDAENLRKTVKTFPITAHYDVGETLTSLGIGEALVTVLTPKGVPTPLAATRLVPPDSMMDAVDATTRSELIAAGELREKYAIRRPRERPRDPHRQARRRRGDGRGSAAPATTTGSGRDDATGIASRGRDEAEGSTEASSDRERIREVDGRPGQGHRDRPREGSVHDGRRASDPAHGVRHAPGQEVASAREPCLLERVGYARDPSPGDRVTTILPRARPVSR
ncbi:MAG: helicase HerA-like domain-containing protein, partial [Gaiellaceae bacterium]